MSVSKPRVSIVGLGLIGGSMGLALRQAQVASAVIGHDRERQVNNEAKRAGAVDEAHWNLIAACEDSDLVLLATPVGAIEETLKALAPYLRPGCVVIDTASVKRPVLAWAAEILPPEIHFIGADPVVVAPLEGQRGLAAARADLFQKGLFCLVPSPTADSDAVKLATDLVSILGASSLFMDAAEHDGLLAAMDHLPAILALTMLDMAIRQPAWRELRKVGGPAFEVASQLVTPDSAAHSDLYLLNRDNLVRWIDQLAAALDSMRQILDGNEAEALAARFQQAIQERQKWLAERSTGEWHDGPQAEIPPRIGLFDQMFGTFWRRKPKDKA
jgi:prephenate dehydrogenase